MKVARTHRRLCQTSFFLAFVLAAFSLLAVSAVGAAPLLTITLKQTVGVDGPRLRLSDIAAISGPDTEQAGAMANTVVAKSPNPGQTRFVGADYVRLRLKQAGFDTKAIAFSGPTDVKVTRRSSTLPAKRIRRAVQTAIRSRMPWKGEDVVIGEIVFDEDVQLPTGKLSCRVIPKKHEDYLGKTMVGVHLFVNGEPVHKIWAQTTITVMAEVVMVVRPMGKHQRLNMPDLSLKRMDLARLGKDTIRRMDDALGLRTTRKIYPNTVLRSAMIVQPPVVKRGDIVKIVAESGGMTITATGLVKQQGRTGQMVRVMNTNSKRVILARVKGPGSVVVDF